LCAIFAEQGKQINRRSGDATVRIRPTQPCARTATSRTVAFLTNKLLLENGMPRDIFKDPNVIDMASINPIVSLIQTSQIHFGAVTACRL
jgi:hypothetical protein